MATTVRITETYDLKTTVNKMGVLGLHTPSNSLLNKLYPGLVKNHRFVRFLKCDVIGACASVLPADPLQVGVGAGVVAPEDMFNPILMKAVTNESFDTLVNRIYGGTQVNALGSVTADDISLGDDFKMYYALLAENGKFKKSMPQSGFGMRKLVPICHTLISTYGNVGPYGNKTVLSEDGENPEYVPNVSDVPEVNSSLSDVSTSGDAIVFRGKSVKMPKIPLHNGLETNNGVSNPQIPKLYVGMLIMPPARLHEFYYRMRVTWTVRFEQVISTNEYASAHFLGLNGQSAYARSYNFESSKNTMDNLDSMVDGNDVSIEKIMES